MARRRAYRRPNVFRSNRTLVLLAAAIAVAVGHWWTRTNDHDRPPAPDSLTEGDYRVEKLVDGDTFWLTNGVKIRLIGADTPETVKRNWPVEPWGPEASAFTKQFLHGGQVRLQFDRERKDRYGRFLAYVWVDEKMLNEELIRAGLARASTQYRYSQSMKTRFRRAEDEARAARRGIWSSP